VLRPRRGEAGPVELAPLLGEVEAEQASLVREGALPDPWRPRGPVTRRQVLTWLGDLRQPWVP